MPNFLSKMTLGTAFFTAVATNPIGATTAFAQEPVKILMLGDEGHHKPSEFYRHLAGPLSEKDIQVQYTQELSDINLENLSKFDGLMIFANVERITPEAESALLEYVAKGGGLIPVHCASYCFLNSDKYIELVGAQFKSHGFTRFDTKIIAPDHEIMKGLTPFSSYDESYMHARHNPDKKVLEVRGDASGPVSDTAGEPYTWVRTSGDGRVFYTAWGHDYRTWENPSFQNLLARGIRWACKLPVESATSAPASKAVVAANREFVAPEFTAPTIDKSVFTFQNVGAKIPNYTPGEKWGTQGDLLTLMQDPLTAEVSINSYGTPAGFSLSIWAKEADSYWPANSQPKTPTAGLGGKPIAMNWDERGRLWVCETLDYPNELQSPGNGRDRIRICEDTDGDGQADKFTVFAEYLSIPTTLVCYRGGVIVQDGQKTVYLKDVDGDDKADFRQELITGWALGDTHGGVSNFQYGPDNWIWGMQGYNNSRPNINGEEQMGFRQGFWRFKVDAGKSDKTAPAYAIDTKTGKWAASSSDQFNDHTVRVNALEFMRSTNNNTWGLGFSEEGYVFGSTANACPSVHMPIPNRYYDQVAGWSPKTLEQISDNYYFHPIDDAIRQVDQHGGYTAGCGHAIYTARNYPKYWWNRIGMVCGPTGHLVGSFLLEKRGAGYRSYDAFNTVASIDDWAAPIMSEVGPDGNVWVLDWYNYIVQHNPTPNGFETGRGNAYESDLRDKRFGRIYRMLHSESAKDIAPSTTLSLAQADAKALVMALKSDNFFWRRTAQRLIIERRLTDQATLDGLVALLDNQEMDDIGLNAAAMHALWTLAGLAETGDAAAVKALASACGKGFDHQSSPVRHAAVMSCGADQVAAAIEKKLHQDADPKVKLAVLLRVADGEAPQALGGDGLAAMAKGLDSVAQDDILLDAWTAAASTDSVDTLVVLANEHDGESVLPVLLSRVAVLAEHVARSNVEAKDIERLLDAAPDSQVTVAMWQGLAKGWPRGVTVEISADAQKKLRERFLNAETSVESKAAVLALADRWSVANIDEIAGGIQDELFDAAKDSAKSTEQRVAAWNQAIRLSPASESILEATEEILTPQLPPEVGVAVINGLQAARVDGLAKTLLDARGRLSPRMASQVLTMMLSRADLTKNLLDAISEGKISFTDLQLDQRQALMNHPTKEIAALAKQLMESRGATVTSNRQGLVDDWMPVTKMTGNVESGIAMYKKHCALCHQHGDMGVSIGPNLTGMAVHPKEEIVVHVLDPSRSVESNFRTYQILTADGAVLTGMLAGESANSLRVINSQGKTEQVLREDIEEMNASTKSLMPEGFESLMTKQEFADLLTFLTQRGKYTPLPITAGATVSSGQGLFFNKDNDAEKIFFKEYGVVKVEGIPFQIDDPQDGRVANLIMLRSPLGEVARTLPESASIPITGKVSAIHMLGGIAGWGFPYLRTESTSLVVRCIYEDGTTADHKLINGKHIADYIGRIDVPDSTYAMEASGRQIRYLKIEIDGSKPLKAIEFRKGGDQTAPMVFAVTIESAEEGAH